MLTWHHQTHIHSFIQGHLVRGAIKITIESMQKTPNRMRKENEMPEKCERRVNGKINAFRFFSLNLQKSTQTPIDFNPFNVMDKPECNTQSGEFSMRNSMTNIKNRKINRS